MHVFLLFYSDKTFKNRHNYLNILIKKRIYLATIDI